MEWEPLRLLHVTGLHIDRQFDALTTIPDDLLKTVEDATVAAFHELVAVALQRQVDSVLLVGETFCEADRSLRARLALEDGLRRLAEQNIQVLAVSGESDPPSSWSELAAEHDNLTVLSPRGGQSVEITRNGTVEAVISATTLNRFLQAQERRASRVPDQTVDETPQQDPLPITLLPVTETDRTSGAICFRPRRDGASPENVAAPVSAHDPADDRTHYVALGGVGSRRTFTLGNVIAHHPGPAQPVFRDDTGPCGCTLVTIDREGTIHREFIATGIVRRESATVQIDAQFSFDELIDELRTALNRRQPETGEKMWLMRWIIRGSGPLFDRLNDSAEQEKIRQTLPDDLHRLADVAIVHEFAPCPDREVAVDAMREHPAIAEFHEMLEHDQPVTPEVLQRCLEQASVPGSEERRRLQKLIGDLEPEAVAAAASRLGLQWFTGDLEPETAGTPS